MQKKLENEMISGNFTGFEVIFWGQDWKIGLFLEIRIYETKQRRSKR